MSIGEMLVILIVAILVMKPEDIPLLLKKTRQLKLYILQLRKDLKDHLDDNIINDQELLKSDITEINLYLQKISDMGRHYIGDYSLDDIKTKYQSIIMQEVDNQKSQSK